MKRVLVLTLVLLMLVAMAVGCTKQQTTQEASSGDTAADDTVAVDAATEDAPVDTASEDTSTDVDTDSDAKYPGAVGKKASIILKDLTNPFWITASEGAIAAAKDFGIELEVMAPLVSNNNDEQIQLVQQSIAKKMDIVILTPADSTGIVPAVNELNNANIPVINLNTKINNESGNANSETFVVADNILCATLGATALAELAGGEGEAIILQGPMGGQVNIDLTKGAVDTFATYPGITVVDEKEANADRATAYKVTQDMLITHPNLKIIFACNDEMALGALKALEEAGKEDDVIVGGIDGNADAFAAVKDGRLDVTVFKNVWLQAYTAVEAAARHLNGEELPDLIPVNLVAVTQENIDEFLK